MSLTWPADRLRVTSVRHRFLDWLRQTKALVLADDLALVVTELVTNAREASSELGGEIGLEVCIDAEVVVVEVTNLAERRDLDRVRLGVLVADPRAQRGRGLAIVEQLTDSLSVNVEADRITVRATRRFGDLLDE